MACFTTDDKGKALAQAAVYVECARAIGLSKKDGKYKVYGLVREAQRDAFVSCVRSKGGQA